ncbi:hypothetical protein [Prosthecobacter sp.]|uniref:hypothetical protein n=1 Tax=Prosthecobacter sp. TaxID=1965333 RepID=UPI0037836687
MDGVGDFFSALAEIVLEVVIFLLELLFYVVESIICAVLWLCRRSEHAGPRQRKKLPEKTRYLVRSCMHTFLAIGLLFAVLYFGWWRQPAVASKPAQAHEPTKVEKAQRVIEKARQIKDTLLPSKPKP